MISKLGVLLFVATGISLDAQVSVTDGTTPPAIQPGAPVGTYALSGFESVNLYNGHLQVSIPLLKVGGRGEAGYTISLPIQRNWRIESHVNNNNVISIPLTPPFPGAAFWGTSWRMPLYTPGKVVQRSIVDTSQGTQLPGGQVCPTGTAGAGHAFYLGPTLTRLTFIEDDGTEHELRDTLTNGQPSSNPGNCLQAADQATNRGTVFVTNDSTSATFIADNPVFDVNTVDTLRRFQNHPVSGWLLFKNGVKFQTDSTGDVVRIQDRNGNEIQISGGTITDSLGRVITVQYADLISTFSDTITYPGYGTSSGCLPLQSSCRQIKINWTQLQNVLFPGVCGGAIQNTRTLFPSTNPTDGSFNPWVASSITLPDTTAYTFQYNCYAELKRVQLPTGGAFEYDYPYEGVSPYGTPACDQTSATAYGCTGTTFINDPSGGITGQTVFRRVMQRRVMPNGSTVEGRTLFIPTHGNPGTTVQVDKTDSTGATVLSREMHYFYGDASFLDAYEDPVLPYPPPFDGKEYETDRIALETGPTAVAQKTVNTWAQRPCGANENNCSWIGTPPQILHDPNICQTNLTLQEVSPIASGQVMLYDRYNNRTDLYEYDFGAAPAQVVQSNTCPTTFTGYSRHTSATFLTNGYDVANTSNASASIHIRDLPTDQTVSDTSGTVSQTDYSYDQYASFPL